MPRLTNNVLVTGGAGYIGSHACKALARSGYLPVAYDSLIRGNAWAVRWGPLEVGDVMDGERLRDVLHKHRPVGVIHFAAFAYVGESMSSPNAYYANNVGGTISLLRAMAAEGVDRLVLSSTCATYGIPKSNPICEDMPQIPISPYGRSKLMAEQMLRDCTRQGKLTAVALRYFNAAGADADCEIGEAHNPETHLVPLVLGAAQGTAPALTVFGNDHDTPDGTCVRDYVHVTDLADAHVRALEHAGNHRGFSAFNLGTGTGISINELISATQDVTGRAVPFAYGPRRDGDPGALVADPTLAADVLGWKAQHSDIGNILNTSWAWLERKT